MKIHVVTVANKKEGYFDILKKSCLKNGCKLTVLGFGKKWKGYVWRINLMINYLNNVNDNDLVVFCDGFDVVMLSNIKQLYLEYKKFNKSIVIGIEDACDFKKNIMNNMFGNYKGYQICAGLYIGKCFALKKFYKTICSQYNLSKYKDDQKLFTHFFNNNKFFCEKYLALDIYSKLFLNCSYSNIFSFIFRHNNKHLNIECKDNKIIYKKTNTKPIFIHGPGNINLKPYLEYLNYKNIPEIKSPSINRIFYYLKLYIKNFKSTIYLKILLLITIIIIIYLLFKK